MLGLTHVAEAVDEVDDVGDIAAALQEGLAQVLGDVLHQEVLLEGVAQETLQLRGHAGHTHQADKDAEWKAEEDVAHKGPATVSVHVFWQRWDEHSENSAGVLGLENGQQQPKT